MSRRFKPKDSEVVHAPPELVDEPARKAARGRPSKLTPAVTKRICDGIAAGLFLEQACKLANVSADAVNEWRTRAQEGSELHQNFVDALEQAELRCEERMVKIWTDAAPSDFRTAQHFMAKRWPTRWSDSATRMAVFGADEGVSMGGGLSIVVHLGDDHCPECLARAKREHVIEITAQRVLDTLDSATADKV